MMKMAIGIILTNLLVLSAFASDGKLLFVKGKVLVNSKQAKKGDSINYGDEVVTGKKSLAVLSINPGARVKLKPTTSFVIKKPSRKKTSNTSHYLLKKGEVFIKAIRTEQNRYRVKTRNSVMGVRGTRFFISQSSDPKKPVWMCVDEGAVEVQLKSKKKVLVKEGEGVAIEDDKVPEVKKYKWTKKLNWKMKGKYKEMEDKTDIQNINYDLKNFDYE